MSLLSFSVASVFFFTVFHSLCASSAPFFLSLSLFFISINFFFFSKFFAEEQNSKNKFLRIFVLSNCLAISYCSVCCCLFNSASFLSLYIPALFTKKKNELKERITTNKSRISRNLFAHNIKKRRTYRETSDDTQLYKVFTAAPAKMVNCFITTFFRKQYIELIHQWTIFFCCLCLQKVHQNGSQRLKIVKGRLGW